MSFEKFKEATTHIKNLKQLIGDKFNVKVISHKVEPLTKSGENFGSEILKVGIIIEENGVEKEIHAVAKLIPPTEFQLKIFNTQVTFKNEIAFYTEIVGAIREFQEKHVVEPTKSFAEIYGSRINLTSGSDKVDTDGIILLENLKVAGFDTIDRVERFDLNEAKKVLACLADFQATVLAIRIKEPELFDLKIKPYFTEFSVRTGMVQLGMFLEENPATAHLANKVKQKIVNKKHVKKYRETWATIIHNDLWVNNIMMKKHRDGDIQDVKLVDFQVHDLASPACDVLFFLFSSVQEAVLRFHFDRLIQHYYKGFVNTLSKYKISNRDDYTFDSFKEELKAEAHKEIYHVMFMLPMILAPKGTKMPRMPGKVPEWPPNKENGNIVVTNEIQMKTNEKLSEKDFMHFKFPPGYKEAVCCMVELAEKQKWL